ncbi:hypothetical protein Tco_0565868 [Tanacetum coccineum]
MSQPANDEFSQHLSDDEASNHEDASEQWCSPKQQQPHPNVTIPLLPDFGVVTIPKEHMRRFHRMDDAKEIWEAIRTRFGGNANSKKMQKAVFKQQFEAFIISSSEGKSSTNKVKPGFTSTYNTCTPSTSLNNTPEKEALAGFADEIDDLDIEEMDINWQIAMIAIRMKKFYKKTGRRVHVDGKALVGFDKKKLECFNYVGNYRFDETKEQKNETRRT